MKDTIKYLVWIFAIVPFLIACGDSNTDEAPTDDFDVRFELPATVDVAKGGELTFTVKEGKSPQTTDSFLLEGGGISYLCSILSVSSESFTVRLADECESGSYTAYLKRDARKKQIGKIYINIVDKIDFEPSAGTTVFGLVSSEEGPVANVVVSDGTEVTVTDDKGIYELKSAKKWGYVFISVPSGYEVAAEGVFPQFYQTLKGAADVVEQKDFKLTKVDGQDRYKLFLLGDMHLANRTNDAAQFTQFTTDLNAYMAQHSGQKMYALTLGDMTWDLYWYKNNYALPQYRETINRQVKNLQIYHTMGNHDNDFMTTSDYDAAVAVVGVRQGESPGGQTVEKELLGLDIGGEGLVVVEMVVGDVGEDAPFEMQAADTLLHDGVRRHLHEAIGAARVDHFAHQRVEPDHVGRGMRRRDAPFAPAVDDRRNQSRLVTQPAEDLCFHRAK